MMTVVETSRFTAAMKSLVDVEVTSHYDLAAVPRLHFIEKLLNRRVGRKIWPHARSHDN